MTAMFTTAGSTRFTSGAKLSGAGLHQRLRRAPATAARQSKAGRARNQPRRQRRAPGHRRYAASAQLQGLPARHVLGIGPACRVAHRPRRRARTLLGRRLWRSAFRQVKEAPPATVFARPRVSASAPVHRMPAPGPTPPAPARYNPPRRVPRQRDMGRQLPVQPRRPAQPSTPAQHRDQIELAASASRDMPCRRGASQAPLSAASAASDRSGKSASTPRSSAARACNCRAASVHGSRSGFSHQHPRERGGDLPPDRPAPRDPTGSARHSGGGGG